MSAFTDQHCCLMPGGLGYISSWTKLVSFDIFFPSGWAICENASNLYTSTENKKVL